MNEWSNINWLMNEKKNIIDLTMKWINERPIK